MGYIASIQLPPKGFIVRRFIELSVMYLRGVEIVGDKLVITSCRDLCIELERILSTLGDRNVYLTGNDVRGIITRIATLLGVSSGGRALATDLLKSLVDVIKARVSTECITKDLIETRLTPINLFKSNFYEYGRVYLARPATRYVGLEKIPVFLQLLGMLGALLADAGRVRRDDEVIHYYVLPPEGISSDLIASSITDVVKKHKVAVRMLNRFASAPRALYVIKLSAELIKLGYTSDEVVAELVSIQEGRNRATIMSVEPLSTEGLVSLILLAGRSGRELAERLSTLAEVAIESLNSRAEVEHRNGDLITRMASDLITYARTCSLDALYSIASTLMRLTEQVRRASTDASRYLTNRIKGKGISEPANWLAELAELTSRLMNVCLAEAPVR
ncbi:MAG: hypothetical protein DRO14_01960 [Thermoprotei archaeon]|nr:MAG: hypothetical protein DRO14_01960 [Thermoprotei archaeon]